MRKHATHTLCERHKLGVSMQTYSAVASSAHHALHSGVSSSISVHSHQMLAYSSKRSKSNLVGSGFGTNKEGSVKKLEPLWDDGYGSVSLKDYIDAATDMIVGSDAGPPRWFCPIECGSPLKDSPPLMFLPGMDGLGMGLILHHKALGKVFEVRCMHIPVHNRTPFEELVKFVENAVRIEHASSNKPIFLVAESLGGCLALSVAARNPSIDLVVILVNPATAFNRSQLQRVHKFLEFLPDDVFKFIPCLFSFTFGDPIKMAMVNTENHNPSRKLAEFSSNLTALLSFFYGLADIIPKETFLWKLKMLKDGDAYANARLHAVKAEVLVLASCMDRMIPSRVEAQRLANSIMNCKVRYFRDNEHILLMEDGVNLLTIIKATCIYRRSRRRDYVTDYLPPSVSEFKKFTEGNNLYRNFTGQAMFSIMGDGKVVRGLAGIPDKGPVLLVGNHMLMGLELYPIMEEFLREKQILLRGVAHPSLFQEELQGEGKEFSFFDNTRLYGAFPVSASNIFKLFATNSHVLLYPGGSRESFHHKGQAYKLFWPDQPEFVRMAAKFGATVVPFGVVGEDDLVEFVLDYNDLTKIPIIGDYVKKNNERVPRVRDGMTGVVDNQPLYLPGLLPKVSGRLYCMFGKPIQLKGRQDLYKDKQEAREVYLQIKSEVENIMAYLIKKREEDPYGSVIDRTVYRAFYAPMDRVPTFEP